MARRGSSAPMTDIDREAVASDALGVALDRLIKTGTAPKGVMLVVYWDEQDASVSFTSAPDVKEQELPAILARMAKARSGLLEK